jgi:transposase
MENNPARAIEAHVNSLDVAALGRGRPEPDGRYMPKDVLKWCLYGYMSRTRSSQRLETESERNLEALRPPGERSPDHKTIAEFRRRNGRALKRVFKGFVRLCARLGLYGKKLAAVDGGEFKAVDGKERNCGEGKLRERMGRVSGEMPGIDLHSRIAVTACGLVLGGVGPDKRSDKLSRMAGMAETGSQ